MLRCTPDRACLVFELLGFANLAYYTRDPQRRAATGFHSAGGHLYALVVAWDAEVEEFFSEAGLGMILDTSDPPTQPPTVVWSAMYPPEPLLPAIEVKTVQELLNATCAAFAAFHEKYGDD